MLHNVGPHILLQSRGFFAVYSRFEYILSSFLVQFTLSVASSLLEYRHRTPYEPSNQTIGETLLLFSRELSWLARGGAISRWSAPYCTVDGVNVDVKSYGAT